MGKEMVKQTKYDQEVSRRLNAGVAGLGKPKPKARVATAATFDLVDSTPKVADATYSHEFWRRAGELIDSPKKCEQCRQLNNPKARPSVVVRVVLVGDGTPLPHRLRLLCVTCHPEPRNKNFSRKEVLANIGDLFDHAPRNGG